MDRATKKFIEDQNEKLAIMVARGFESVDKRFDTVDKRFENMDRRFDRLENDLESFRRETGANFKDVRADIADLKTNLSPLGEPRESEDLYGRVGYLEKKLNRTYALEHNSIFFSSVIPAEAGIQAVSAYSGFPFSRE